MKSSHHEKPSLQGKGKPREDSQATLAFGEYPLPDELQTANLKLKPRRRLLDSATDRADGLDILIQKTKAIGLKIGEEGLSPNEDGNQWLEALNYRGEKLLWGVKKIRKYVCGEGSDSHAAELIQYGVLHRLAYFLDESTDSEVLFEVLWILTNIAAGPTIQTTYLVDNGFLQPLGKLLNHPLGSIRTQSAWAIGNIIGDREGYRDLVLQGGLLPLILNIWKVDNLDEAGKKESLRISLWIVDNMCRYKPDWQLMEPAFNIIPSVLNQNEPAILKECCWALARILHQSGRHAAIERLITPVLCNRLIEILRWKQPITSHPILRALINLASSKNPLHLRYIIHAGVLDELEEYLVDHHTATVAKHSFDIFCVQILGNLFIHQNYASKLEEHYSLCQWIVRTLDSTRDKELKIEICITLKNILIHKLSIITGIFARIGLIPVITRKFLEAPTISRHQLTCLECINFIAETRDLKDEIDSIKTPIGFVGCDDLMYDYKYQLSKQNLYCDVLQIYHISTGKDLLEIDEDVEEENDRTSDSDTDEIQHNGVFSFEIANHKPKIKQKQKISLKDEIGILSLKLLKTVYAEKLQQDVQKSQEDQAISQAMMGMEFGAPSNIVSLADAFGRLAYQQN